ncbi:MAG TPA: serine/threonine-protein kinase [Candidatus Acidoferrum sp.]|nr:serine/threonine-protein kinase [Candidatus Acidoferrum sp.]
MDERLPIGESVEGWVVEAVLGTGGFAVVYRVRRDGAFAALKVPHGALAADPGALARFRRETEVVQRIRHPNICAVLSCGELADGRPYIIMEYLEGEDLHRRLQEGRMAPEPACAIVDAVAAALEAAHQHGVIHRDVKASNVFLTDHGNRVVLLDFGIAKLREGAALTGSREIVGTPESMAPEQLRGGPVDERTDVYGLGVLVHSLLIGASPFSVETPTLTGRLARRAARPRALHSAQLPIAVYRVVTRAMALDPANRYRRPSEVAEALSRALSPARPGPHDLRLAVLVSAVLSPDAIASPDEDTALAVESLLAETARLLERQGLELVLESTTEALYVGPLSARAAVVASLRDWLAARSPGQVGTALRVRAGTAAELTSLAWADRPPAPGLSDEA